MWSLGIDGVSLGGAELTRKRPDGRHDRFVLGSSRGLTASIKTGDATVIDPFAAEAVELKHIELHFASGGVELLRPATLTEVRGGIRLGEGLMLTLSAEKALLPSLRVVVGSVELRGRAVLTGLVVECSKAGDWEINAERLVLEEAELRVGTTVLTARDLAAEHPVVHVPHDAPFGIAAHAIVGQLLEVRGPSSVDVHGLSLAQVSVSKSGARAERVTTEKIAIDHDLSVGEARDPAPKKPAPAAAERFDPTFLDGATGRVEVDVGVDARIPVLGKRVATHRFRIPVDDGAINFKQVEKSLAWLEDAALDFEVEPGKLILEKDLPLIPFDNTPLVIWRLTARDQALAAQKRVRLRRLFFWELTEATRGGGDSKKKSKEKSAVGLNKLDFDNLLLDLSLTEPFFFNQGPLQLSSAPERAPIERLKVTGALRHRATGDADGTLSAELTSLAVRFGLALGTLQIAVQHCLALDKAALETRFAGFAPRSVTGTLHALDIERPAIDW